MQQLIVPSDIKDLITTDGNAPLTTSLLIAERHNKEHRNVLRAIDEIIELNEDKEFIAQHIQEVITVDRYRRPQRTYELSEEGYFIVAAGFTGADAINMRTRFTKAFIRMRDIIQNAVIEQARVEGKNEGIREEQKCMSSVTWEQFRQYEFEEHRLRWQLEVQQGYIVKLENALAQKRTPLPKPDKAPMPKFICSGAKTIREIIKDLIDMDNSPYVSNKVVSLTALKILLVDKSSLAVIPYSMITDALDDLGFEPLSRVRVKGGDRHAIWSLKVDDRPEVAKILDFKSRVETMENTDTKYHEEKDI